MSKHTPGPWICSNEGWGDGMADVRGANNEGVCLIPIFEFCSSGDGDHFDNKYFDGDRTLILAAPDLLEALEVVNQYGFSNENSSGWGEIHITREDWNAISAAIARAKGESQ